MITVIEPHFYWPDTTSFDNILQHIERCGRICYKSEFKITEDSAKDFVRMIVRNGHESVLEHVSLTAIVVCSRSCSHQLVRHRIAAFSQQSQRYVSLAKSKSFEVICPPSIGITPGLYTDRMYLPYQQKRWIEFISNSYQEYVDQVNEGVLAEDARYVLPNATKTELAVTFNLRQWRHVFKERALNTHAQWEIRKIFTSILMDLNDKVPTVFEDLL